MNLTDQQQKEISIYLKDVSINESVYNELYDHVITDLESRPEKSIFKLSDIKQFINKEFTMLVNTPDEMRRFSLWKNIGGGIIFAIALITYWLTMEPTLSFWDCGEFILAADKIQVGHQPGAPLFLLIGKMFSLLSAGNPGKIAYWVNFSTVLASAATIAFLFWTIVNLAVRLFANEKISVHAISIFSAGTIGALSFCFSDSFWFSAVEAEVYALSSLFTALTFWAITKWERALNDRWLIFIAFMVGLSTGVHLLSLLTIPAISMIYYFRKSEAPTKFGWLKAFAVGCVIVAVVQFAVLQYFVLMAAKFDLYFVNTLGFPFGSGGIFFALLFICALTWAIRYSIKTHRYHLNLGLLCTAFLFFGFSAYAVILIRANAKTNVNLSNPDNLFSLYNYLGRTNYVPAPLIFGQTFDAKSIKNEITGTTYRKGKDKYEISGNTYKTTYDKNSLFPRMYSHTPDHISFYQRWMGMQPGETPNLIQNIGFFASWQLNVMYLRYFMWNFSGKQNDVQGYGGPENGNWITGINALDAPRLGSQKNLPESITQNAGHNVFYGLPVLLGLIGLIWLFRKNQNYGFALFALFFYTGIAIIIFLNQDPLQVRERDYAYVGSFYAFAIFIGFGFFAVSSFLKKCRLGKLHIAMAGIICLFSVPLLMAARGWDDHDRSGKTTAIEWATNYLNSCAPNAILFTNADNDTYPLWYAQEVEGIRPDVRVISVQFLSDASFLQSLKKTINKSEPLPISMANEKFADGTRDYMPYVDYGLADSVELSDLLAVLTSENKDDKVEMQDGSFYNFLPTKKLKLTINKAEVVRTGTVSAQQRDKIASVLEWNFNKSYALKSDLAIFDILVHNNWRRPVYFATSVSSDTYIGLDKYLYLEGYAYRLLPLQPDKDFVSKETQINTDVMYANMMNKFSLSGFKTAKYLDVESRRIANATWRLQNTLATALLSQGDSERAAQVMRKSLQFLPMKNYSIADTLQKIYTAKNLYDLGEYKKANSIALDTVNYIQQELSYIAGLSPGFKNAYVDNVQFGLSIISEMEQLTGKHKQQKINKEISNRLNIISDSFTMD